MMLFSFCCEVRSTLEQCFQDHSVPFLLHFLGKKQIVLTSPLL